MKEINNIELNFININKKNTIDMNGYKQLSYLTFKGEKINIINGKQESDKSDPIENSKLTEDSSSVDFFETKEISIVSSQIIEESSSIKINFFNQRLMIHTNLKEIELNSTDWI